MRRGAFHPLRAVTVLVLLCAACAVDDSALDTQLFECAADGHCGEGWGCVHATPVAVDFCAPRCTDATCDGICTSDQLCLRGCQLYDDGTTSACSSDDYACIRTSADRNSGVCYPVTACATTADCAADETCLSGLLGADVDRLYCVPNADAAGACAPGSVPYTIGGSGPICFPTCGDADSACPPSFGCLGQAKIFEPDKDPPCLPGVYGISCVDDTNCLSGRCLDADGPGLQGKICTVTCGEASREFSGLGCSGLVRAGFEDLFTMECDPTAGGGEDGGLCSVRYTIGWPSCTPPGGAYPCASTPAGTSCLTFESGGERVDVCTRSCTVSSECNASGASRNYCAVGSTGGLCLPRRRRDGACYSDEGCVDTLRCVGSTAMTPGVCT